MRKVANKDQNWNISLIYDSNIVRLWYKDKTALHINSKNYVYVTKFEYIDLSTLSEASIYKEAWVENILNFIFLKLGLLNQKW